jgi:hypothetical protein
VFVTGGVVSSLGKGITAASLGALAGLNLLGELSSLGSAIERTPLLRDLDAAGRQA